MLKLRRYKLARDWGVPSSLLTPEGQTSAVTVNQKTDGENGGSGFLKGALVAGLVSLGAAGVGFGVSQLLSKSAPVVTQPQQLQPMPAQEWQIKWWVDEDGKAQSKMVPQN